MAKIVTSLPIIPVSSRFSKLKIITDELTQLYQTHSRSLSVWAAQAKTDCISDFSQYVENLTSISLFL
ncbi:hypothetical protein GXM_02348 [Nostoc sphaeroides CCNUC1]|uniref:Uncharacterized protein n=1 Tax=Nostoc sphaeroides CCNUC1 TaxID=2653204 RepID=A0A5P8VWS8_9NOSO|nr:hypothetical protein GXM_02348 [Nostoc sphaeroides CCNUC1]